MIRCTKCNSRNTEIDMSKIKCRRINTFGKQHTKIVDVVHDCRDCGHRFGATVRTSWQGKLAIVRPEDGIVLYELDEAQG